MKKKQSHITLSVDEVVKNKYFPYLLVVLLIMGFFLWILQKFPSVAILPHSQKSTRCPLRFSI